MAFCMSNTKTKKVMAKKLKLNDYIYMINKYLFNCVFE